MRLIEEFHNNYFNDFKAKQLLGRIDPFGVQFVIDIWLVTKYLELPRGNNTIHESCHSPNSKLTKYLEVRVYKVVGHFSLIQDLMRKKMFLQGIAFKQKVTYISDKAINNLAKTVYA